MVRLVFTRGLWSPPCAAVTAHHTSYTTPLQLAACSRSIIGVGMVIGVAPVAMPVRALACAGLPRLLALCWTGCMLLITWVGFLANRPCIPAQGPCSQLFQAMDGSAVILGSLPWYFLVDEPYAMLLPWLLYVASAPLCSAT